MEFRHGYVHVNVDRLVVSLYSHIQTRSDKNQLQPTLDGGLRKLVSNKFLEM